MKRAINLIGVLMGVVGIVWILQGFDVMPGSFMSGHRKWALNGAITLAVGAVLVVISRRTGQDD